MRVLGIDPGTRICGYGLLELRRDGRFVARSYGVIRAEVAGAEELPDRLLRVFEGVSQLIEHLKPTAFAIEEAFVFKNPRSALAIGHGRAAAIVAARRAGVPVFAYAPSLVKKAVTGSGRASKAQIQALVAKMLSLPAPPEPADAADALAIAFTHAHRAALDARLAR